MSSKTKVVLVHGPRSARCTLPILVGLLALTAPLVGQARRGHVYHVNFYQVRPGEEKAYDSALVSVVTPVFDELVKRKAVVSYLLLTKTAGSGEYTNVVIVEVRRHNTGATARRLAGRLSDMPRGYVYCHGGRRRHVRENSKSNPAIRCRT